MKRLNIFYVRHGNSCYNIAKKHGYKKSKPSHKTYLHPFFIADPLLSQIGVDNSELMKERIKNKIKNIDMVISSILMRAIETAGLMFPDDEHIYVYPYISELNFTPYDLPLSILSDPDKLFDSKKEFFKNIKFHKYNHKLQDNYLDQSITNKLDRNEVNNMNLLISRPGMNNFLKLLGKTIHKYIKDIESKDKINIVVVTHGNFIDRYIKSGSSKMDDIIDAKNSDVFLQKYLFDPINKKITLDPCYSKPEKCHEHNTKIFDGPEITTTDFCQATKRCRSKIPSKIVCRNKK